MNERDRLIELLQSVPTNHYGDISVAAVADHLLANCVIVPPFTVGQTIYIVDYFSNEIIEGKYQGVDCSKFESIFTTREEAEQALKERSEKE